MAPRSLLSPSPPPPLSALLETLFVLSLAVSLLSSSGLSSPHPDIITLPLTPDIITLVQQTPKNLLTTLPNMTMVPPLRGKYSREIVCRKERTPYGRGTQKTDS